MCYEAAKAAGWDCGYAKNVTPQSGFFADFTCTVECEYGRGLPCEFAPARRRTCAGCNTGAFMDYVYRTCHSSADTLTSAWCQPDTNADGSLDCNCFVACDGHPPAQVEYCG